MVVVKVLLHELIRTLGSDNGIVKILQVDNLHVVIGDLNPLSFEVDRIDEVEVKAAVGSGLVVMVISSNTLIDMVCISALYHRVEKVITVVNL